MRALRPLQLDRERVYEEHPGERRGLGRGLALTTSLGVLTLKRQENKLENVKARSLIWGILARVKGRSHILARYVPGGRRERLRCLALRLRALTLKHAHLVNL